MMNEAERVAAVGRSLQVVSARANRASCRRRAISWFSCLLFSAISPESAWNASYFSASQGLN